MAKPTKVNFQNASPRGAGDLRLNSIPAKTKHLNDYIDFSGAVASTSWRSVSNTTAFVQNSDSEVTMTQPANTIIGRAFLVFTVAPVTAASADLGYEVGTAAGGGQVITQHADNIIDAGADGTDLAVGAVVEIPTSEFRNTLDATTLAVDTTYTASARTIYCNTVCSNHSVTTAGTVVWSIEFVNFA